LTQKTTDRDLGYKHVIAQARKAHGSYAKIGYFGKKGDETPYEDSGVTIAEVAIYNEYGTETAPPRSFMRAMLDRRRNELLRIQNRLVDQVQSGKLTMFDALTQYGEHLSLRLVEEIQSFTTPENAAATIAAKGSEHPLIDTGAMMGATDYRVVMN